MTSNVISLASSTPDKAKTPVPQIIEFAEQLLEGAKSGEVQAVAIATIEGEITQTCYSKGAHAFELVGAVAWLQQRIINSTE